MTDKNDDDSRFDGVNVHTPETLAKREPEPESGNVKAMLKKREKQIRALLSGQLDPVKFATVAMTTIRSNEKLMECSPISLVTAIMMAAQRGLSLDPTLGHAYLVPYWNSKLNCREAQYQTGYQGKIHMALRDGGVVVDSFVIYKNDTFEITGTAEGHDFKHVPTPLTEDPGESVGYVARARLEDGRSLFEVMRRADVEKIRQTVKARYKKDTPAWKEWFDEMGRGKAVNRLAKYLPQSPMLQLDAAQESVLDGGKSQVIEVEAEDGSLLPMVVPKKLADDAEADEGGADTSSGAAAAPQAPQTVESDGTAKDTPQPQNGAQGGEGGGEVTNRGPVTSREAVGAYIKELREGAGISQAGLAEGLGVSPSTVGRIETGKTQPDRGTVIAIAHYLAVMPEDLLAVAGYPTDGETEHDKQGEEGGDADNPPDDMFKLQAEADQNAPQDDE